MISVNLVITGMISLELSMMMNVCLAREWLNIVGVVRTLLCVLVVRVVGLLMEVTTLGQMGRFMLRVTCALTVVGAAALGLRGRVRFVTTRFRIVRHVAHLLSIAVSVKAVIRRLAILCVLFATALMGFYTAIRAALRLVIVIVARVVTHARARRRANPVGVRLRIVGYVVKLVMRV